MFEDILSPEYNMPLIPPVFRIPFPVPVFLILYIAILKELLTYLLTYFMYYSRVVIILFSTGLYKSGFATY